MTRRIASLLLVAAWLLMPGAQAQAQPQPRGHLVVVGGGGVPDAILTRRARTRRRPGCAHRRLPAGFRTGGHRGRCGRDVEEGRRHERAVATPHRRDGGAPGCRIGGLHLVPRRRPEQAHEGVRGNRRARRHRATVPGRRRRGRHERRRGGAFVGDAHRGRGPPEHHGGGHQDRSGPGPVARGDRRPASPEAAAAEPPDQPGARAPGARSASASTSGPQPSCPARASTSSARVQCS